MGLRVSQAIRDKLKNKHQVTEAEVTEAFMNRTGKLLEEVRPQHQSTDKKFWFISETDLGRKLKVVFAAAPDGEFDLVTAYEPNATEEALYEANQ